MGRKLDNLEEKPGAIESTYLGRLAVQRGGVLRPEQITFDKSMRLFFAYLNLYFINTKTLYC